MLRREWEFDLRRIIQANIDRFKKLLETETDPTKRAMEGAFSPRRRQSRNNYNEGLLI